MYDLIARPFVLLMCDGRDEVEVRVELLRVAGVVEDHPDAARLLDREALVDAGIGAALAEHDLAGDLRRIERGVPAVVEEKHSSTRAAGCTRETRVHRVDERRGRNARPAPDAGVAASVAERDGHREALVERARCDRGLPRHRVVDRRGPRACVAGSSRDEHTRCRGVEERELIGTEVVDVVADREVDDVHAVVHGVLDRSTMSMLPPLADVFVAFSYSTL